MYMYIHTYSYIYIYIYIYICFAILSTFLCDAHNVRKTLKKVQNASRMYVLDMCGYKKWVLQPQFTYRQPPQAHSAHSNMGGSEALTIKGGLASWTRAWMGRACPSCLHLA